MQKYFFINPQLYNAKKNFKMYNKSKLTVTVKCLMCSGVLTTEQSGPWL